MEQNMPALPSKCSGSFLPSIKVEIILNIHASEFCASWVSWAGFKFPWVQPRAGTFVCVCDLFWLGFIAHSWRQGRSSTGQCALKQAGNSSCSQTSLKSVFTVWIRLGVRNTSQGLLPSTLWTFFICSGPTRHSAPAPFKLQAQCSSIPTAPCEEWDEKPLILQLPDPQDSQNHVAWQARAKLFLSSQNHRII